jgi:hypothetical protein
VRVAAALVVALGALIACGSHANVDPLPTFSTGAPPRAEPPANVVGGFTIELPQMTLAPGDEQTPCYIFPLVVIGPSSMVGGGKVEATAGLHHGNVNTRPKTGDGVRPCPPRDVGDSALGGIGLDIAAGGAVLFGSSTQFVGTEWQSFPDGMAFHIDTSHEIVARMHYLNPTNAPITLAPKYTWYTIDESKVTQEIAPFIWRYSGFTIPPQSTTTVTGNCNFGGNAMHIVSLLPHMHAMGVRFTAGFSGGKLDGKNFLDSKGYDPSAGVRLSYDPGIDLSQGDGATFSCTWHNSLGKTLVEGIGDDEMCMHFGYGWPVQYTYSANVDDANQKCVYVSTPGH